MRCDVRIDQVVRLREKTSRTSESAISGGGERFGASLVRSRQVTSVRIEWMNLH
jgi:hypothetical protein